jgi:hypothetical protein
MIGAREQGAKAISRKKQALRMLAALVIKPSLMCCSGCSDRVGDRFTDILC